MKTRHFTLCAVLAAGLGGPAAAFESTGRIVLEPVALDAIPDTGRISVSSDIPAGSEIEIVLPHQPGTGFEWHARPGEDGLLRLISECESPGEEDRPGSTGQQSFIYRGETAGSGEITFRYVQPWAPETAAIRVELQVTITGD